jgi:methyl acetate hydrolase
MAAEIVFAAGVAVAAMAGTANAQNSPGSAAIDASLRGAVERKDVPGVVALITDREHVLYQSAFGVADVATGRPLTTDALFRIASMTKPVTSVALMQLVEQGRLGLDDPAEKYLPQLAGLKVIESFDAASGAYQVRPASRQPTVRHFLTHTSGLAYPFTSAIWRDFKPLPVRRTAAVRSLRTLALQHQHRCGRQAGRGGVRPKTRGLFPRAHLCATQDG